MYEERRDERYWKVWGYLVQLVQEELERTNEADVARRIGVTRTTVNRWVRGQRGDRVDLSVCLRIIATLGGDLVELARELGFEKVARILELREENQQLLLDIMEMIERGGPAAEKLRNEVEFLKKLE